MTILRASKFAEDSGPFSHPIQPKLYVTWETFYTATVYKTRSEFIHIFYMATVYNKESGVIHMLNTIVGPVRYPEVRTTISRKEALVINSDQAVRNMFFITFEMEVSRHSFETLVHLSNVFSYTLYLKRSFPS